MDLTSAVERMKSMEQRLGISLEGLYAKFEDGEITINFELHVSGDGQLAQNIAVVAAVYDKAGRVIDTHKELFLAENVFGFVVGSTYLLVENPQVSKIRVYPEKI